MGSLISLQKLYNMRLLILSFLVSVSLAEPEADAQYLTYAGHHVGYGHLGYAGVGYHPYTTFYGKREAEADPQYVTYAGHHLGYSHLGYGYAGYHPYTTFYGKREADPQVVAYGIPAVHHAVVPYAAVVVPGLVAHPNGAVVPVEPHAVVKARAEHLAAKASA